MNDEQKEKAKERAAKARAAKAAKTDSVARIASIDGVSAEDTESLLAQIAGLREQLAHEKASRSEEQQTRLDEVQAQGGLMGIQNQEKPTGKMVEVRVFDKWKVTGHTDHGEEIRRPVFRTEEVPTYFYKIDMPPCGGTDLKINGIPFYHNSVVEVDINVLRTIKEMVFRCWKHDTDIHGSDENFFRKDQAWLQRNKGIHA